MGEKNKSFRWKCKICDSDVFIVKTQFGDYFECPNCGFLQFSQINDKFSSKKTTPII